ncbi:MAG: hypothetical protein Ta2A_06870 [Treponemataceae bacterium]|nr:MAG: hypothetical protein Ta2A_06870 [Treponemataceae bacterium]
MKIPARCARSRAELDISVKICYTISMKKFHIVLTAVSAILVVSLFSCGEIDKTGIFFSINNEIKLNEGKIHGNIMSILEIGGTIYAGAGNQIWSKPVGSGSWGKFDSPGGTVVALGQNGGNLYAMTSSTSSPNKYFKYVSGSRQTVAEAALPGAGGSFPWMSTAAAATIQSGGRTSALCWHRDTTSNDLYIGETAGAVVKRSGATDFVNLPGKNFAAAIGAYQVMSIYASGDEIYVGIIGRTPAQGKKNNGLWCYDKSRDVWDRV